MIALALTVALTSSTGSLSDINPAQRHARFIESPVQFAGSTMLGADKPYDLMSLQELQEERLRLQDSKHGLGGGIALVILGPVTIITGAVLAVVGVLSNLTLVYVGYVLAIVGSLMTVAGIALIVGFSVANGTINRKIRQVDARISQLQSAPPAYAPPPGNNMAPPPPPPATQNFAPVLPSMTDAEF